jgi:hypothetical protein
MGTRLGSGSVFPPLSWAWPQTVNDKGAIFLESREARIGTSVGVLDVSKRIGKGRVGTIEQTYGHPEHLAVDVRFADGSVERYRDHELLRMRGRSYRE